MVKPTTWKYKEPIERYSNKEKEHLEILMADPASFFESCYLNFITERPDSKILGTDPLSLDCSDFILTLEVDDSPEGKFFSIQFWSKLLQIGKKWATVENGLISETFFDIKQEQKIPVYIADDILEKIENKVHSLYTKMNELEEFQDIISILGLTKDY